MASAPSDVRLIPCASKAYFQWHPLQGMYTSNDNDHLWHDAKKKLRLSAYDIHLAQKLGLNPKKLGSIANHRQETCIANNLVTNLPEPFR